MVSQQGGGGGDEAIAGCGDVKYDERRHVPRAALIAGCLRDGAKSHAPRDKRCSFTSQSECLFHAAASRLSAAALHCRVAAALARGQL